MMSISLPDEMITRLKKVAEEAGGIPLHTAVGRALATYELLIREALVGGVPGIQYPDGRFKAVQMYPGQSDPLKPPR